MKKMLTSTTSVLGVALKFAPVETAIATALLILTAALFLSWFARQKPATRRDVVRLLRALRAR